MSYPVTPNPIHPVYPTAAYPQFPQAPQSYPQMPQQAPQMRGDYYQPTYQGAYPQQAYPQQPYPQTYPQPYPQQQQVPQVYSQQSYPQPYPQGYPQPYPQGTVPQPSGSGGLGSLIAAIMGLFKKPAPAPQLEATMPQLTLPQMTQPTVALPSREQLPDEAFVTDLYVRLLGRQPDPDGFMAHVNALRQGTPRQTLYQVFIDSPEYKQRSAMPTPVAIPQPASQPVAQPAPQPTSITPVAPMEGFDFNKLNNPNHRTPKYIFARIAASTPLTSVVDHASADRLLKSMRPQLEAAGLRILDVKNDKIHVVTEIGAEWVDVVARAGAGNPAWWWGSEGVGTPVS